MWDKRAELTGAWGFKVPVLVLSVYFLVFLPSLRFFFRGIPWLYEHGDTLFYAGVVLALLAARPADPAGLGFSAKFLKPHLMLGAAVGLPVVLALPLLDLGLEISGLAGHELFRQKPPTPSGLQTFSMLNLTTVVLWHPLIEQVFFSGFVVQSLLKKTDPVLAVYGGGLIYTLAGFHLSLGAFALGLVASWLFRRTGTLYASLLFHMSCALAGVLLLAVYPRLVTLLGFLL